jgi:hypothetical protein
LYYNLHSDKVPVCGGDSQNFKGRLDTTYPVQLAPEYCDALYAAGDAPEECWSKIESGAGTSTALQDAVVGIEACTEDQIAGLAPLDGCGMLIPISSTSEGTGDGFRTMAQVWTVWMVWQTNGAGATNPNSIGGSGYGEGCKNPIVGDFLGAVGVVKHCGLLLGPIQLSGGEGGGDDPLNRGAIVVKLVK